MYMKRQIILPGIIVFMFALVISACKKEKGETNDEELITTMVITATPQGGGTPLEFSFKDLDGPGGNPATIDNISLAANETYDVTITLLNETVTPAEDITEEVEEENAAHRFYYELTPGVNVSLSDLNDDDNGVPLGTTSTWTTTATSTGQITITLRHYPGNPPDKQTPDPVNSPKSATDIQVVFPVLVQ
jgi:hypothetical protein